MKKFIIFIALFMIIFSAFSQQQMTVGGSYSQNFNSLSFFGDKWVNNSTIKNWYWSCGNSIFYFGDDGSYQPTSSTRYAYHSKSGEVDLSIGGITVDSEYSIGFQLVNVSGADINSINISYTGEQWRYDGTSIPTKLTFSYQVSASPITDLFSGSWTNVNSLDFVSPIAYESDNPSSLDGNSFPNKTNFSNISIPNLTIPNGSYIMFRWGSSIGASHGLSVDDFTISWIGNTVSTNGNWNNQLIWTNGYPSTITNAIINGNVICNMNSTINNLIINNNSSLTINNKIALNVIDILIKSNSTGNGSLLNNGNLNITGNSNVELYVQSTSINNGIYFSPPVSNLIASNISDIVYEYDAINATWVQVFGQLTVGKGYTIRSNTDIVKTLNGGSLRNSDLTINNLVRNTTNTYGWNLVGNPFVCGIDWTLLNKTNLTNGFYIRTKTGTLISWVNGVGNPISTTSIIPPMQAFYAQVLTGQTTGSLTIPLTARTHDNNNIKNKISLIRLKMFNDIESDETVLRFDDGKLNKMFDDKLQLFTITDDNYCINTVEFDKQIKIGYITTEADDYTILAFDYDNLSIYLKDNLLNTVTDLSKNSYTFNSSADFNTDRFSITISKNQFSDVLITSFNKNIFVDIKDNKEANLSIYNSLGQEILNKKITQNENIILNTGFYIIKVVTDKTTINKIII